MLIESLELSFAANRLVHIRSTDAPASVPEIDLLAAAVARASTFFMEEGGE